MERTEKREAKISEPTLQLQLIERAPLEEAWENVLEILDRRLGKATVNAWIRILRFRGFENGNLELGASTKFIANQVSSHYRASIIQAWTSLNHVVDGIQFNVNGKKVMA